MPTANSTYPKVAVHWLNQALCFYQSFCLVDSEVLRNRHLRVAAKRYASCFIEDLHLSIVSSCSILSKSSIKKLEVSPLEVTKGIRFIFDEPDFSFLAVSILKLGIESRRNEKSEADPLQAEITDSTLGLNRYKRICTSDEVTTKRKALIIYLSGLFFFVPHSHFATAIALANAVCFSF